MTEEGLAVGHEDSSADPEDEGHHLDIQKGGTVQLANVAHSLACVCCCCVLESLGFEGLFNCLGVVHGLCELQDEGVQLTLIVGHTVRLTAVLAHFLLGVLPL